EYKVATPVNWKDGEDVIILPALTDAEAKEKFPNGWKAVKPYLRIVPQPGKAPATVHYRKNGITTFDVPVTKLFDYMSKGNHKHQAFKSHRFVGINGNVVTIEA